MKRRMVLFVLIALLLALSVHAADTIRLEELGLQIDVPSEYYVITRNMAPDDPALSVFDMDSDQVTKLLESNDMYLDLLNNDDKFELTLTMAENAERTLNQFDEDTLESLEETLAEQYDSAGLTVNSIEHFTQDSTVFFQIYVSGEQDGNPLQLLRYYTVHNYQTLVMDLQYWGNAIPESYEKLAKGMVSSIRFDQVDEVAQTISSASAAEKEENSFSLIEESAAANQAANSAAQSSQNTGTASSSTAKKKRFPTIPVVLGTAALCAVLGVIIRKKQQPADAAAPAKRVCAACGAKLAEKDRVCPKCGKKVK